MTTIGHYKNEDINLQNSHFSSCKTIIETAFYGNNVQVINSIKEAYQLAAAAPNTIVLDQKIKHAKDLELDEDTHVIVANGGAVVGRTAKARRIKGQEPNEDKNIEALLREDIYQSSFKPFISAQSVVGLDKQFMIEAHIMMPKQEINNMYSWLLNFQILNDNYQALLEQSLTYDENDIFIYFNPDWKHDNYPDGLAYFDTKQNVAAILGMNYFGEIKKGTLTLAWATAARNNYVACHGGLKEFRKDGELYVASFFGLSGSGKSTLTHAKHDNKYEIQVLHDDAFVISTKDGSAVALEPAYFDKTNDYPVGHPEQDYFLTVQNCGVTLNESGERVLVTEDIRNGNGRTIKSRYSTPDRVDVIHEPISAIFWIMKDESLPPLVKISDPTLASAFGCTLMTKRSNAENTSGDLGKLVIEPYANPFRIYPLIEDFEKFHDLFASGVEAYIINTGSYLNTKISKEISLSCIEKLVDGDAMFKDFAHLPEFSYLDMADFKVDENDTHYLALLKDRMAFRLDYLKEFQASEKDNSLLADSISKLETIIEQLT